MSATKEVIATAIRAVTKHVGAGSIVVADPASPSHPACAVFSTGIPELDEALGVGGWPRGRVVEVVVDARSPEGLAAAAGLVEASIAAVQRDGGVAALIDMAHDFDPHRAGAVNMQDLLVSQPDNGEQGMAVAEVLVRTGAVSLVVVDHVAGLVPERIIAGDVADDGLQARQAAQALRKLTALASQKDTVVLFINRRRPSGGYGDPDVIGSNALKFYSSVRVDLRVVAHEEDVECGPSDKIRVGWQKVVARVLKNKVAAPFTEASWPLVPKEGDR